MKIVGLQLDIVWKNKAANVERVRRLLADVPLEPGSLVVLPEMFASGFSMDAKGIAEPPDGETVAFLSSLAREREVGLLGGVVCRDAQGRARNQVVAMDAAGREVVRFTKLYPFSLTHEQRVYTPGDGVRTFDWGGACVAPFICYDLRFPEAFRAAVRRGATLLVVVANWPATRALHWTTLLRARAIENQAFVVGVNRCGADPRVTYSGQSLIVDPRGKILADAGREEGLVQARIDLDDVWTYREEFPAVRDMKPPGPIRPPGRAGDR